MSSPKRVEIQIENQIKKRINQESPSKNDIDFYVRKARRLEGDYNILQDQLSKLRVRLRRAQDYEIKYEILLNEISSLRKDVEEREKSMNSLKSENERLRVSVHEKTNKDQEWAKQKRNLLQQIQTNKQKVQISQKRRIDEIAAEKLRAQQVIKREIAFMKRDFEEREDEYKFEIRQLKKIIHQKQTVEAIIHNRVEKIRKQKDQQINRLSQVIESQKEHQRTIIEQKNDEIDKLKEKFEKMINFELQNLKKNLDDQDEMFSIELNGLRQIIGIKNDEITKLLQQIKRQTNQYAHQRQELLRQIKILKDKLYQVQRQAELELFSMKQRLAKLHSIDLQQLEKRQAQILQNLRKDKEDLQNFLKDKDRMRDQDRRQYERAVGELNDKIKERDHRITSLLDRIKQSGDVNTGQLKNLHQSFHKIEVEKESLTSEYQNNIQFMTQQIAKLTTSNEVKNAEMKKLYEQIHDIKKRYEEQIRQTESKYKKERKERDEERERERLERQKIIENMSSLEREFKNTERRLEREREKQEREKNKLKFIVQQLQKDVDRLNKYIKQLDQNLKNEYKRSQINILDGDGARRQLTSQLQKQKAEMETLKKMEVDQIRRKFEMQTTRVINQNDKLKTDLLTKSLAYESLETEYKKLENSNKNIDRINKEKLMDYQKKMATLNNEINLTQNLYQAFLDAKSRARN